MRFEVKRAQTSLGRARNSTSSSWLRRSVTVHGRAGGRELHQGGTCTKVTVARRGLRIAGRYTVHCGIGLRS